LTVTVVKTGRGEPASIIPITINSGDQGSSSPKQTFDVEVREHPAITWFPVLTNCTVRDDLGEEAIWISD